MSNSAQHKLSYRLESTYGVSPTTGAYVLLPHVGTTIGLAKGSIEAQTIRSDRQVEDVRHGNRQVGGQITTEFRWVDFDPILEALMCGTWTSDVLVPGVTRRSFSILRQFSDQVASGDVMPFQLFKGCEFNTLNLTLAPESLVKADFSIFGREYTNSLTRPGSTTETAVSANKPFDSFRGQVTIEGSEIGYVTEIQLNIENGIEPRFVAFDDRSAQGKLGRTRITGSLTIYFQDAVMLNAFNAEQTLVVAFELEDLLGNIYQFNFPRVVLTGGQPDVEAENDITITVPFAATYDPAEGHALQITRIPT